MKKTQNKEKNTNIFKKEFAHQKTNKKISFNSNLFKNEDFFKI
jgi:hypothetical protein